MLKITDSKTFQQIESTLNDGMIKGMRSLNETAITNSDAVITAKNCKALKLFFEERGLHKVCPVKDEFQKYIESGKIKLVHDSTSNLQTLVYAFPIQASSKDTYLIFNATHFFSDEEILTETGTETKYTVPAKNEYHLSEIANICVFMLNAADSVANISKNMNTKKDMMNLYTVMMSNVLISQGTINSNKENVKTLKYFINLFFLKNMFATNVPIEVLSGLAAKEADLSNETKKNADLKLQLCSTASHSFDDINQFIISIKEIFPSLGDITLSNLINKFALSYTPAAVMCIDYLPYVAAIFAATATKNMIIGGASFRGKVDMNSTPAMTALMRL